MLKGTSAQAQKGKPEGDFKYVLFGGLQHGSNWPFRYPLYHMTVTSVDLEWPAWLPYIDIKTVAPSGIVSAHTHWPERLRKTDQVLPGSRVAAIFLNDKVAYDMMRRKGWVDVSKQWHEAHEKHLRAQAEPAVEPVPSGLTQALQVVTEVATNAIPRRGRAAAANAEGL